MNRKNCLGFFLKVPKCKTKIDNFIIQLTCPKLCRRTKKYNPSKLGSLVSCVNPQRPAAQVCAVHFLNGPGQAVGFGVFDKAEAFGPASVPVLNDFDRVDGAVLREGVTEFLFADPPGDVSNE